MPSWQSYFLRLTQHGFRTLKGRFTGLDVSMERRNTAIAEKMYQPSSSIQYSAVTANSVPAEWIVPMGLSSQQVVMYVHGGAFYSGSLVRARPVAGNLALASKARVLTIDYRLAPE